MTCCSFIHLFTIYSFLRIFLLLLLQIISLEEGRRNFLSPPSPPLNLILFQFPIPETFIQIMASISRPLKNVVPTLPIVAKRIGGGGTSAFSEGVPAAVGPRALSPRESRGEVHRQRRTQAGQRLPNDVLTKENRYAWFTHAREDASKGVQGAGVRRGGYIYIYVLVKGCRRGNRGEGRTESHSSPFVLPFAAN